MRKKKRHSKQSVTKNVALLFLSLALLAGASMLFTSISSRSDLSLKPIQSTITGLVARDEKPPVIPAAVPEKKKKPESTFDYSFYDILNQKEGSDQAVDHYSVQIAAFRSVGHAESLAREIRETNNLRCRVEQAGGWSCVRWGTFSTVDSAEQSRMKLSDKLKRNCKVVKM